MVGVVLATRLLEGVLPGTLEIPESPFLVLFLEQGAALAASLLVRVGLTLRVRLGLITLRDGTAVFLFMCHVDLALKGKGLPLLIRGLTPRVVGVRHSDPGALLVGPFADYPAS